MDVRGLDGSITIESGEYVPEDMITYWFNQNTVFEGNEELAAEILETGKSPRFTCAEAPCMVRQ